MTVGVLGGGQLGRMLALAGYPLGLRFRFLDHSARAPGGHLAELHAGDYEDIDVLERFAEGLDVVTYEFENVPVASAQFLAGRLPVYPPPQALEAAQDRLVEKSFFHSLDIPTPPFLAVDSEEGFRAALRRIGLPAVLKTRRMGYDGKGQIVLREPKEAEFAWRVLGDVPQILEGFVPFQRELSVLAVRGRGGETAFYPLVENHHRDGMLRLSLAPAPGPAPELQTRAEDYARRVLTALDYVGVLAIEFFEAGGRLLANEMAPRVHNSGHWTIEGAVTSQFENHLRAGLGLPLGSAAAVGRAAMVNLIGHTPPSEGILRVPGAHLHLYGKAAAAGRKLGHVTLVERDEAALRARLDELRAAPEMDEAWRM
ncbi:MAG TPA: 5-(carboxyamino)imidazole ribonucleotide synthase [Gemmataceae bacterium]|nr:5-(carboxyamino)imidazole ribonucleotide synthase [Gemmataceae bacterium]